MRNCPISNDLNSKFMSAELQPTPSCNSKLDSVNSESGLTNQVIAASNIGHVSRPQGANFEESEGPADLMTDRDILHTDRPMLSSRESQRSGKGIKPLALAALNGEAVMRVRLEGQVQCNPHYKTLYYGLKKNHPRNLASAYAPLYMMRRVIYTMIILFMTQLPFIGVVILMLSCVFMLAMIFSEKQWEDGYINQMHIVNEIAFYLVLLHVVVFCGLTPAAASALALGWSLVAIILATIAYNIIMMLY